LLFWMKSGNKSTQKKINQLLFSINETPYSGIGKPEALKHRLAGLWSRRIDKEHRLVYEIDEELKMIIVHSLRGHY
ncbi:MAG TPA: Txe/YoeB family addiction module toxin, partial [Flavobacterium sp.]|nr:Txe/YoeB family addiction module toxin [Flavobacterium sp.]